MMPSFLLDSYFVEILDEHGQSRLIPFQQALETEKKRIIAQERALSLQRSQAPLIFINLPDQSESLAFQQLAKAICDIAAFKDIAPETRDQAIWMRCVQLYWQAKAITLANKIYKLLPDPTQSDGTVRLMLPSASLANLQLDVAANYAWYRLLEAGSSEIEAWASKQGISYPFNHFQELFIETLKIDFEISLSEGAFSPVAQGWSRKQERDHYRSWLKFLGDHFNGEPKEKEYEAVLRSMSWKGYALLALRTKKREKPFNSLWRNYLKKHRPLCKFLNTRLEWEGGIPYQSATANGRRTKTQRPIQGVITDDGYLDWQWY